MNAAAIPQNIWKDEYAGEVYTYAMKFRPAMVGFTCPRDGYLLVYESDPIRLHADYPHGLIFYSRPLTPAEVATFQLAEL